MGNYNQQNEISRCTVRFYDPYLVSNLKELWSKMGGSKNSFITSLINEGIKSMTIRYSDKPCENEISNKGIDEIKNAISDSEIALLNEIKALRDENSIMKMMLATIYHLNVDSLAEDEREFIESGVYDYLPSRLMNMKGER